MSADGPAASPEATGSTFFQKARNAVLTGIVAIGLSVSLQGSEVDPLYGKSLGPIEKSNDWDFEPGSSDLKADDYDLIKNPQVARTVADTNFLDGVVTIDGFKVNLHENRFFKSANPKNELLTVSLIDTMYPEDDNIITGNAILSPQFKYDPYDYVDIDKTTTYSDHAAPSMGNGISTKGDSLDEGLTPTDTQRIVVDHTKVRGKGKGEGSTTTESIDLDFIDNTNCEGVDNGITSEIILPPRYLERVCGYLGLLDELVPDDYRIFLNYIEKDYQHNDMIIHEGGNRAFLLTLPFKRIKKGYDESYSTSLHEALHTTYFEEDEDSEIRQDIDDAYEAIRASMTYRMPDHVESYLGYDVTANEPGWAAITESTYEDMVLGNKDSGSGHPWDNPTEMLSSTASVLSVYPKEFLKNYAKLDEEKQEAVKEAVTATIEFLKATTTEKTFSAIMPRYELIRSSLSLDI